MQTRSFLHDLHPLSKGLLNLTDSLALLTTLAESASQNSTVRESLMSLCPIFFRKSRIFDPGPLCTSSLADHGCMRRFSI